MKRSIACLAAALWLMTALSGTVSARTLDETVTYPLAEYADKVTLVGGATAGNEGIVLTDRLSGAAFYSECDGELCVTLTGDPSAVMIAVDGECQTYAQSDGMITVGDIEEGMHRFDIWCDPESADTVIDSVALCGSLSPVPVLPQQVAFVGEAFSLTDMYEIARYVGMTPIVVTAEQLSETSAAIALAASGEETLLFAAPSETERYVCATPIEKNTLDGVFADSAVMKACAERFVTDEQVAEYLENGRPTADTAAKIRLETALGNRAAVSALYKEAPLSPMAAVLPPVPSTGNRKLALIIASVCGVGVMIGIVVLVIAVIVTPKADVKKEDL